jgi:hypothetical protein
MKLLLWLHVGIPAKYQILAHLYSLSPKKATVGHKNFSFCEQTLHKGLIDASGNWLQSTRKNGGQNKVLRKLRAKIQFPRALFSSLHSIFSYNPHTILKNAWRGRLKNIFIFIYRSSKQAQSTRLPKSVNMQQRTGHVLNFWRKYDDLTPVFALQIKDPTAKFLPSKKKLKTQLKKQLIMHRHARHARRHSPTRLKKNWRPAGQPSMTAQLYMHRWCARPPRVVARAWWDRESIFCRIWWVQFRSVSVTNLRCAICESSWIAWSHMTGVTWVHSLLYVYCCTLIHLWGFLFSEIAQGIFSQKFPRWFPVIISLGIFCTIFRRDLQSKFSLGVSFKIFLGDSQSKWYLGILM